MYCFQSAIIVVDNNYAVMVYAMPGQYVDIKENKNGTKKYK